MNQKRMLPLEEFYKNKKEIAFWWYSILAYILFVILLISIRPENWLVLVIIWVAPLFLSGFIDGLRETHRYDFFTILGKATKWVEIKFFGNSSRKLWLSNRIVGLALGAEHPKKAVREATSIKRTTNKISFSYFVMSMITLVVYITVYNSGIWLNKPSNNIFVLFQLILYIFTIFDLASRFTFNTKNRIQVWRIRKFVREYSNYNSSFYNDEEILTWVKDAIKLKYQISNKPLENNIIFAIGESVEQDYYEPLEDDDMDGFFRQYQDVQLYKVYDGEITLIRKDYDFGFDKYYEYPMNTLEAFKYRGLNEYIDKKAINTIFKDLNIVKPKATILQWQIFISGELKFI